MLDFEFYLPFLAASDETSQEADYELEMGEEDELVTVVSLEDQDTGETFDFALVDEFEFEGQQYAVLVEMDPEDENEVSAVIMQETQISEDAVGYASIDDDRYDAVANYYMELCEADEDEIELEDEDSEA